MNIALIGYGKMGKAIEEVALEKNIQTKTNTFNITHKIDIENRATTSIEELSKADVAIEFTSPHTALDNIYWCFEANVPVVVGSTGWTDKLEEVKKYAIDNNKAFLFSPNYSLGVNIFFEINRKLAHIMNDYSHYDVQIEEIHHIEKKDAPSGTGLYAAEDILKIIDRKNGWTNNVASNSEDLSIISLREPNVPGTHTVSYISDIDKIDIVHTAFTRKGFASGAILAAQWLYNKKGAFSMDDVLGFNKK
jgi:4-hydroxy-tetrahydrodipicolinate reductase